MQAKPPTDPLPKPVEEENHVSWEYHTPGGAPSRENAQMAGTLAPRQARETTPPRGLPTREVQAPLQNVAWAVVFGVALGVCGALLTAAGILGTYFFNG